MWLITADAWRDVQRALTSGVTPTSAQSEAFTKERPQAADTPRNMKIAGNVAEINVSGVLVRSMDVLLWIFGVGQTTYESIIAGLAQADADPNVKSIVLSIDSPGGQADGLFEAFAALESTRKPISVRSNYAASAAYGLAAVAGKITATNPAATFGSVGVVASFLRDEDMIDITSTEAPDKRPDPSTEEGKAVIREYLDAIHDLFADAIARGRSRATGRDVSAADVNEEFGRGAVLLAAESKRRGMIDSSPKPPGARASRTRAADEGASEPTTVEESIMTLEELKAQHPHLCTQLVEQGREEGRKEGTAAERDRVNAHLVMGKSSDAMDIAMAAVEDGSAMTETLRAKYFSCAQNKRDVDARQADSDAAVAAVAGAEPPEDKTDADAFADKVASAVERQMGVKIDA